jgi:hypothetical protein
MKWQFAAALVAGILELSTACNAERKKECDQLISALAPLDDEAPTSASIARLRSAIDAQTLEDQPLHEYASTLKSTLEVLWSTLAVKEAPSPPDGTDDVVKAKIKQAKAARDDVTHYCSE